MKIICFQRHLRIRALICYDFFIELINKLVTLLVLKYWLLINLNRSENQKGLDNLAKNIAMSNSFASYIFTLQFQTENWPTIELLILK